MGRQIPAGSATDLAIPWLLSSDEWDRAVRSLHLSPQQAQIVALIVRGRKDKQIAAELGLAFSTVRTYLARIFAKLGVTDRVELVACLCAACIQDRRQGDCQQKC